MFEHTSTRNRQDRCRQHKRPHTSGLQPLTRFAAARNTDQSETANDRVPSPLPNYSRHYAIVSQLRALYRTPHGLFSMRPPIGAK